MARGSCLKAIFEDTISGGFDIWISCGFNIWNRPARKLSRVGREIFGRLSSQLPRTDPNLDFSAENFIASFGRRSTQGQDGGRKGVQVFRLVRTNIYQLTQAHQPTTESLCGRPLSLVSNPLMIEVSEAVLSRVLIGGRNGIITIGPKGLDSLLINVPQLGSKLRVLADQTFNFRVLQDAVGRDRGMRSVDVAIYVVTALNDPGLLF
jgi:hypothetical protein